MGKVIRLHSRNTTNQKSLHVRRSLLVSRLFDGRLCWLRHSDGMALVFEDGSWVPAKGLTVGAVTESKPLSNEDISELISQGILPAVPEKG